MICVPWLLAGKGKSRQPPSPPHAWKIMKNLYDEGPFFGMWCLFSLMGVFSPCGGGGCIKFAHPLQKFLLVPMLDKHLLIFYMF